MRPAVASKITANLPSGSNSQNRSSYTNKRISRINQSWFNSDSQSKIIRDPELQPSHNKVDTRDGYDCGEEEIIDQDDLNSCQVINPPPIRLPLDQRLPIMLRYFFSVGPLVLRRLPNVLVLLNLGELGSKITYIQNLLFININTKQDKRGFWRVQALISAVSLPSLNYLEFGQCILYIILCIS